MRIFLITALLFLLSAPAFTQFELQGKVTDVEGIPLVGANVRLLPGQKGTFTDGNGMFHFYGLSNDRYTLEVNYVGYETVTREVALGGKAVSKVNVTLKEAPRLLDEVVVKATRAGEKAPFSYVNLDKEDLERRNLGQDVPYLLDATPSVVVTSDAGAGIGYTGMRIRGTDPTRINVTINGIPLNDSESQNVFWVDLPDFASSTNDIQIQRGVGTSTNGAGAFGATVNLNTGKLNLEPYAELSGTIGSFQTYKANATFGTGLLGKKGDTGFTLDGRLSKIVSDGYIDRAEVDLDAFFVSGAWIGKKSALRANIFSGHEVTYQAWNGVPAQYVDDDELRTFNISGTDYFANLEEPHDNEVDDYTQTHYQLLFTRQLSRNLDLNVNGHYTRGYGFFEQYKVGENLESDYGLMVCDTCISNTDLIRRRWLDNHFYGAVWSLSHVSNSRHLQTTLGGAWNRYDGDHYGEIIWAEYMPGLRQDERYYFGNGDKRDFNIYGKMLLRMSSSLYGFADLQYRRVGYEVTGTDNDLREIGADVTYNFFNPKAGFTYEFDNRTSAYASFAVANREPNRNDFIDATPGVVPRPERLYNTEVGVQLKRSMGTFSANLYHMQYKDQLVLTGNINDVGAPIRTNVADSYRLGLELWGSLVLNEKVSLDANATFSRNKIRNFTEYIDNWDTWEQEVVEHGTTDLAFSPSVIAFVRGNYEVLNGLTVSLSAKHVGDQYIDNASNENTVLDAYTVSDLQVRWILKTSFAEELSFNLLINNVWDAKYSANAWTYRYISEGYDGRNDDPYTRLEGDGVYNLTGFYPQAGRNFLLGVTVRF